MKKWMIKRRKRSKEEQSNNSIEFETDDIFLNLINDLMRFVHIYITFDYISNNESNGWDKTTEVYEK